MVEANPFAGIRLMLPPSMLGRQNEAQVWPVVAEVVIDMRDAGPMPVAQRVARLRRNGLAISVVNAAMARCGAVEKAPRIGRGQSPYQLTPATRQAVAGLDAAAVAALIDAGRGADPKPPEWPKRLPCPRCRQPRMASWAGDRYHDECRESARRIGDTPEYRLAAF